MGSLPLVLGGAASLGAAGVGAGLLLRSILRPDASRAFMDYGTPEEHGIPAQDVQLPNGIYGWWAPSPDAEVAVLLVHGRSRAAGWMYPIAAKLWPRTSVMSIDLPGHGKSRSSFVSYGFSESVVVRDAVEYLSKIQRKPIVVIGISMGGASAIIAQANYPSARVSGIVTIGTYTDIKSVFVGVCKTLGMPWAVAKPLLKLAGKIGGFNMKDNRPVDCVQHIRVPFLAVQGDTDELVPVGSAKKLAKACTSKQAGYAYYHGLHDEPSNKEMFAFVNNFVLAREAAAEVARFQGQMPAEAAPATGVSAS